MIELLPVVLPCGHERRPMASTDLQVTLVMKFGGSSVASAERMREVAEIICSFPEELPCVVLSAMGKVSSWHPKTIFVQSNRARESSSCSMGGINNLKFLCRPPICSCKPVKRRSPLIQAA